MNDDDDIWTISDTDVPATPATPDDYPTPDTDPGGGRFWTVGRVMAVVAVAVVVGGVAYLLANRSGDDDKVSASGDMTPVDVVPASDLWGRVWEVIRIEMGSDVPVTWSKGDTDAALDLDLTVEGELRFSGCNGGFGSATYTDGVLKATDIAGTMMACDGDEGLQLMAYDQAMTAFLTEGVEVAFDEGVLVLTGPNGLVRLAGPGDLTTPDTSDTGAAGDPPAPVKVEDLAASLWGSRWELVVFAPVDEPGLGSPKPLPDGTMPVVDTTEVDQLTISGCNGTGGAVHLEGDTLVADGPWAQTKMACEPDLMDQEQLLTEFLEGGPTVSITDDLLTLTGDDWVLAAVQL